MDKTKDLTEEEVEVITERYYQAKVKHNNKVEKDRIKQFLSIDKREEKRILSYKELEEGGITEEEEVNFFLENLKNEEKILALGREVSKLCHEGIREANYLIKLYPDHLLPEQEKVKENLYKIINCFDNYQQEVLKEE